MSEPFTLAKLRALVDEMELTAVPIPGPAPDSAEVRWYRARLKRCPEKKLMVREARERRKAWVRGRGHHDRWMSAALLQKAWMESTERVQLAHPMVYRSAEVCSHVQCKQLKQS